MRPFAALTAALFALVPGGCEGCGASGTTSDEQGTAAEKAAATEGEEHRDPGPPPDVTVHAEQPELGPARHFVPVVQSRGEEPAKLGREVVVEQRREGAWREVATVSLRMSCDRPPERCVTLVPGAELRPPPWLGARGAAQCGCAECEDVPAGTYRFVVRSCDQVHRVPGEAFELAP